MKGIPDKLIKIATLIAGMCLVYFLSIGPVLRLSMGTRLEDFAEEFYSPVLDNEVAWPVILWYLHCWDLYHPIACPRTVPQPK